MSCETQLLLPRNNIFQLKILTEARVGNSGMEYVAETIIVRRALNKKELTWH